MEIGWCAASTNIASAVRKYQADFRNLLKQTEFEFKKAYLKQKESSGKEVTILKAKKRGRPKLFPEEIMKKAIQTIKALRLKGSPISYNVINAIAKGIVIANDKTMLVEQDNIWNSKIIGVEMFWTKFNNQKRKWWSKWLRPRKFQ